MTTAPVASRPSTACSRRSGRRDVQTLEVFNKCDTLTPAERTSLVARYPSAVCVSASTGEGVDRLLVAVTTRLALEMRHVVLEFDDRSESDRRRIARLYRHARVVRHETLDGRVSIEADVPRRMLKELERGIAAGA